MCILIFSASETLVQW